MGTDGGILAIVESGITGEPTTASLETAGAARALAEALGCNLSVARSAGEALQVKGVHRIYELRAEPSSIGPEAAWPAIQAAHPVAIFLPDSPSGRASACTLAARLQADLVPGCALLDVREGKVQLGRSCMGGRAFAQFEWDGSTPIVVSVAQGAFPTPAKETGAEPEVVVLDALPEVASPGVSILREVAPTPDAMGVNDADVLISGGAGVGGAEGFALLSELAGRLGGTIAASRVAVDRGWIASDRQVGLTGRSVAPQVYMAFGISGAPQHIAGIRSAGKVVAINSDPGAPIFDVADLAVVADLHELVPALLERLPAVSRNGKEG